MRVTGGQRAQGGPGTFDRSGGDVHGGWYGSSPAADRVSAVLQT